MLLLFYVLWVLLLVTLKIESTNEFGLDQGDQCMLTNEKIQGTCTPISNCPWALERVQQSQHVNWCGNIENNPVICCPLDRKIDSVQANPSLNTRVQRKSSSDWSKQKCEEYYPSSNIFIVGAGGRLSADKEFPHMAILGYGNETEKEWRCGGSLISFQHVLTAAHCAESLDFGEVKYVRLGVLNIQNYTDPTTMQDFNVKKSISHPDFDYSTLKHDIAILVLDKPVKITDYVKPGCLFPGGGIADNNYITATGWGITKFAGGPSNHLIKVELKIVNNTHCKHQYERVGSRGEIDDEIQVCAGSAIEGKIIDTCEGDSGGPLQYVSFTRRQHHVIFGVTSFGKACGLTKSAGVYTRVSAYLPWIESIVENRP